jgi:hypothetical protein
LFRHVVARLFLYAQLTAARDAASFKKNVWKEGRVLAQSRRDASFAISDATSLQQAGLEEHQSSVKSSAALRVLPRSVQRAKLQGSANFNVFGEAMRGFR